MNRYFKLGFCFSQFQSGNFSNPYLISGPILAGSERFGVLISVHVFSTGFLCSVFILVKLFFKIILLLLLLGPLEVDRFGETVF